MNSSTTSTNWSTSSQAPNNLTTAITSQAFSNSGSTSQENRSTSPHISDSSTDLTIDEKNAMTMILTIITDHWRVVCGVLLFIIILMIICCCIRRRKKKTLQNVDKGTANATENCYTNDKSDEKGTKFETPKIEMENSKLLVPSNSANKDTVSRSSNYDMVDLSQMENGTMENITSGNIVLRSSNYDLVDLSQTENETVENENKTENLKSETDKSSLPTTECNNVNDRETSNESHVLERDSRNDDGVTSSDAPKSSVDDVYVVRPEGTYDVLNCRTPHIQQSENQYDHLILKSEDDTYDKADNHKDIDLQTDPDYDHVCEGTSETKGEEEGMYEVVVLVS